MTVSELIKELNKYPEDMTVQVGIACLLVDKVTETKQKSCRTEDAFEDCVVIECKSSNETWYKKASF